MTYDEHMKAVTEAAGQFNNAVLKAKEDGYYVKTYISGDKGSIYALTIHLPTFHVGNGHHDR